MMRHIALLSNDTTWLPTPSGSAAPTSCPSPPGEMCIVQRPLTVHQRTSTRRDPPSNLIRTLKPYCGISMSSFLSTAIMTIYMLETTKSGSAVTSRGSVSTCTIVVKGVKAPSSGAWQTCERRWERQPDPRRYMKMPLTKRDTSGLYTLGCRGGKRDTRGPIRIETYCQRVLGTRRARGDKHIPVGAVPSPSAGTTCCSRTCTDIWCTSTGSSFRCVCHPGPPTASGVFCNSSHM